MIQRRLASLAPLRFFRHDSHLRYHRGVIDPKAFMNIVMVPVSAFIVLAAAVAVIMSLERILGRPIPKLQTSLPVRRNRAFAIVPISMTASLALLIYRMSDKVTLDKATPSDCDNCAWQTLLGMFSFFLLALALSGAIGWIVYAALWVTSQGWRLISRYVSPAQNP